ncbi:MAG TPA: NUDIX hydrolase [Dehalococcoidia bacterium]|nr:NUDIX hydrolase [Dehalococcoidia bacterium]
MPDLDAALASRHPDRFRKHSMMLAVAGVAVRDGRMLLVRDSHGFWAGVGGWIEVGETPEEAIIREAMEELGVGARVVRVHRPFIAWNVPNSSDGSSFLLFNYGIELASTDFVLQPDEVSEARWFGPDEWAAVPMLPYVRALFDERITEWLANS